MSYVILYFLERNGFRICWDVYVGLGSGGPFSDSYWSERVKSSWLFLSHSVSTTVVTRLAKQELVE